jgi:hypothetical protein
VTYVGSEGDDEGGWFGWLWGSDVEDPLVGREFQVQVTTQTEAQVIINVLGPEGESIDSLEQQGLLTLLQGNIT